MKTIYLHECKYTVGNITVHTSYTQKISNGVEIPSAAFAWSGEAPNGWSQSLTIRG